MAEAEGVRFQTHINENPLEVAEVARLFPWAGDYLAVYEKFGLIGPQAVLAHNLYATESEICRLAATGAAVSHCPCSNAALGSGYFAMRQHLAAGVRFALGTDVGGGTGFGLLKEALQAYLLQRLMNDGILLTPAHLLYLATAAGADAMGLSRETGDFSVGKSADYVYLKAPVGSPLSMVAPHAGSAEDLLAAIFTLGDQACVREVSVRGRIVYSQLLRELA